MIPIDLKPPLAQLRSFGFFAMVGFPLIAVMVLWQFLAWQHNPWIYTLYGLGVLCPLLSLTAPRALLPIYVAMMLVAIPIGFVISAILLRAIYYLMFTPLALWFRFRGRDAMNRRLDPDAETYWTDHQDVAAPRGPASYLRLY